MKTLDDPSIRAALRERIQHLDPRAPAKWGRMNAPQMVCHLNDSFRVGMGEKHASPASSLLQRTLLRFVALHTSVKWPPGVPTRPEIEQGRGGTPPAEWIADRTELLRLVNAFAAHPNYSAHPVFGPLSRREWLTWGYRHVDHHLRQFGA